MLGYHVDDLPVRGIGAFCPTATTTPHASSGGVELISGAPGTLPIPAPRTAGLPIVGLDPKTQGSNNSPDVILPSIYVASAKNMGPPVMIRHHNNLPIPARSWFRTARPGFTPAKIAGRRVIPWPRTFQRWGSVTRTPAG